MKKLLTAVLSLAFLLPLMLAPLCAYASDTDPVLFELYIDSFLVDAEATSYKNLNFKELSRYPEKYQKEAYKFTGHVIQVLGSREEGFEMRIATDGKYDDVVYVMLTTNPGFNILDDDNLIIYAKYYGMQSYQTVLGATVTIPFFIAHLAELNE